MKPDTKLPFKRLYSISKEELAVVKKYINNNLFKGFIIPSTAEISSPVLLVKKPGGGLRFYIDYQGLNTITIKNRYPIPLIREILDRLYQAKRYTKLDIIAAFNRIRIREDDQDLTTFTTRYGTYRYKVIPFGVSNRPGSFQALINSVLREFIDIFVYIYLDDILIYIDKDDDNKHFEKVKKVLEKLEIASLYTNIKKYKFNVRKVKFLDLIITTKGLCMDINKI